MNFCKDNLWVVKHLPKSLSKHFISCQMNRLIFLVGFMGSGKSYWGARLAARTGVPYYDLDQLIETRASSTIPRIFELAGEDGFRTLERETLHDCDQLGTAIVATGGGTPCFFDNMEWMNDAGCTIYLKTPASVLASRLKHEMHLRPLLAGVSPQNLEVHIEKLLSQREIFYNQATISLHYNADGTAFEELLLNMLDGLQ